MSDVTRRGLIGTAMIGGAIAANGGRAFADAPTVALSTLKKESEVACVYHTDFGDPARFNQMLNNISNHYEVAGANPLDLQIVIVAHGGGVKFFLGDLKGTPWEKEGPFEPEFARVKGLAANGLRVYLCAITFKNLKIERERTRDASFIQFVPSGIATVAALQAKGFGYIKTG